MNEAPELTDRHVLYALVGAALLVVMGILVLSSGLIAPPWAVVLLGIFWLAAVAASVLGWRQKMFLPLMWGVVVGVVWVVAMTLGGALLDWRA